MSSLASADTRHAFFNLAPGDPAPWFHQRSTRNPRYAFDSAAARINLNSNFDGGEIRFPGYGRRSFKPPPGSVVFFSCSLLHAVTRVARVRRYAFLPFLYDDGAAKIRFENTKFLDETVGKYKGI